jgi:hypothetical protein
MGFWPISGELVALNLAECVAGQRVDEADLARSLVSGQAPGGEVQQRLPVRRPVAHDIGHNRLAPLVQGMTDSEWGGHGLAEFTELKAMTWS